MNIEEVTRRAAVLYHSIYPRSNFYLKSTEVQKQFMEAVK